MLYYLLHAATLLNSTSNYCSDLLDVCVQQGTAIRFKKRARQKDTPKTDEDEGPPGLASSESSSSDSEEEVPCVQSFRISVGFPTAYETLHFLWLAKKGGFMQI